jgi:ribosomal silencing factor RsfS
MKLMIIVFFIIMIFTGIAESAQDKSFIAYINNSSDGNWFDQAILLNNKCDFSGCLNRDCAVNIFNETIFKQECEYTASLYGLRGKDWEVSGQGDVVVNIFSNKRYYDDLAINIFSSGKNMILHFDITSSVNLLRAFEFKRLNQDYS